MENDIEMILRLRKEAERYRWLKQQEPGQLCAIAWGSKAARNFSTPDECIDAAMAEEIANAGN